MLEEAGLLGVHEEIMSWLLLLCSICNCLSLDDDTTLASGCCLLPDFEDSFKEADDVMLDSVLEITA